MLTKTKYENKRRFNSIESVIIMTIHCCHRLLALAFLLALHLDVVLAGWLMISRRAFFFSEHKKTSRCASQWHINLA